MHRTRSLPMLGFVFVVGGCAIHPVPQDYSGYETYDIVRKITCETRDSLFTKLEVWLQRSLSGVYDPNISLVRKTPEGTLDIAHLNSLPPQYLKYIIYFSNTAIAYNYTFDMTENNNATTQIDILHTFTRGILNSSVTLGAERSRQNIRTFTTSTTFYKLLVDTRDDYCEDIRTGENYVYPITGTIGMDEILDNFVDMTLFGNLVGTKDAPDDPTSTDSLEFITKLYGTVTPKLELSNIKDGVTGVTPFGEASRIDKHKVIIAFALPTKEVAEAGAGLLISPEGTPTERMARQKIQQFILRFELNRPVIVEQK